LHPQEASVIVRQVPPTGSLVFDIETGHSAVLIASGIGFTQSLCDMADEAVIEFTQSGVEQLWTPDDGSLLDLAESHGLEPEFSCRQGKCSTCKVKSVLGKVVYTSKIDAYLEEDEALLCCAAPAPCISKFKLESKIHYPH